MEDYNPTVGTECTTDQRRVLRVLEEALKGRSFLPMRGATNYEKGPYTITGLSSVSVRTTLAHREFLVDGSSDNINFGLIASDLEIKPERLDHYCKLYRDQK